MARKKQSGPTEKELVILSVLWRHGASTVRDVNTIMNHDHRTGYTTTLKLMQLMHKKGLVKRDSSSRTHVYFPAQTEEFIQQHVLGTVLDQVFAGSTEKLVMRALSAKKVSADELANIKKMIEEKERH
jgi:BlaI family transcriptional regulator, penicillinase repressor